MLAPSDLETLLARLKSDRALQAYIESLDGTAADKVALAGRNSHGVPQAWLAEQVAGRRIASDKLPGWLRDPRHAYPPRLNLSQSSSEATATFKAELLSGMAVADLCGGAGIDAYYIAQAAKAYLHIEPDAALSLIAAHNLSLVLGEEMPRMTFRTGIAEDLTAADLVGFDVAYLDPSRLDKAGQRTYTLAEALPDPRPMLAAGGALSSLPYLIKLSPMIDLEALSSELPDLSSVIVVAVGGEVREVLALGRWPEGSDRWGKGRHAIDLGWGGRRFITHDIPGDEDHPDTVSPRPWKVGISPGLYLYEPAAAVNKLGLGDKLASDFGLSMVGLPGITKGPRRYLSERLLLDWHGKVYRIDEVVDEVTRQAIEKRYRNRGGVQITSAWLGDPAEALAKRYGLKAGAGAHLYFLMEGTRRLLTEVTRLSP